MHFVLSVAQPELAIHVLTQSGNWRDDVDSAPPANNESSNAAPVTAIRRGGARTIVVERKSFRQGTSDLTRLEPLQPESIIIIATLDAGEVPQRERV